jgi:transcriptional regulator with XRE-family HTH domain
LLWSITVVTVCPLHEIPLQTRCPYADCARMLPAIAAWSRPAHCSWCRRPLYQARQERPDGASIEERDWDLWVARQLGAILAAGGGSAARRCDDRWAGLERLIHARCGKDPGCYSEFARLIGLHVNNLRRWRAGCALPTIDVLLRACHCLGIALTNLLSGESAGPPTSTRLAPPVRPCRRQPFAPAAGQAEEFQQRVAAVVAESAVRPLSAAAATRRLGCPSGALARLQPEAYRTLTTRYRAYRRQQHDAWVADLAADTKQIMTRLHGAGIYPAPKLVRPQLQQRIHPRNSDFNRIHHQFLAELGWCVGGTRSQGS